MTWQLAKFGQAELWKNTRGAGITVAVLDSGLRMSKALPQARITLLDHQGQAHSGTSGEHGHNCACLLASELKQASGVAPEVKVVSIRVTTSGGLYTKANLKRGLRVALDAGCSVISCSFTVPTKDEELDLLAREAHLRGVPIIAATGNTPGVDAEFPHAVPHTIVVGAVDRSGTPMRGHVTEWTDIFTWGDGLDTATPTGRRSPWKGQSSGATALVAGVVALGLAAVPPSERGRRGKLVEGIMKATAKQSRSNKVPGGQFLQLAATEFQRSLRDAPL